VGLPEEGFDLSGALLVAGTTSDAGKSLVTAGICRFLARSGVKVAPFKAQNMSLNSFVTRDGAEIGRAQAMQAAAAGVEPEAAMNPVLLKPGGDRSSQVVLMGRPIGEVSALSYRSMKASLLTAALAALADLRARFDVVICEGAGSPAEINLRATDIANLGLAAAADLPVVVVGDIDRGGVFASMFGTLALLSATDQARIAGFIVNKFRGEPALLAPGLAALTELTGRPVLGVLPWVADLDLDAEDSLALARRYGPYGRDTPSGNSRPGRNVELADGAGLRVAVIRLPLISNFTDFDALATEPGVAVRFVTHPSELVDVDLVIIPGTRATVADLAWLRSAGLAAELAARAAAGGAILGICGGYQMLARTIVDDVESGAGSVPGLGLLPATVAFGPDKVLGRPSGSALGAAVQAYEIHHGVVSVDGPGEPFLDGVRVGSVWGTTWHGVLENDEFRRRFLTEVAIIAGRGFVPAPGTSFAARREQQLDVLGDLIAEHLDPAALLRLIENGAPAGLPFVPPGAPVGASS
jgi:adenosylcobyric acid synthase